MPRFRITIEYDGTPFVGWQIQAQGLSVQGALTEAIRRFSQETVTLKGAGRTDAGVHALGQVAHFDLVRDWEPFRIREAMNFHLKAWPVVVLDAARVDETFDARFSATARHYRYRILNRRAPAALERHHAWRVSAPLDVTAMQAGASRLIGRHDFTTFRAGACQAKSPVRTLDRLCVSTLDLGAAGREIVVEASARSFLHSQVRSLVGTLKAVGEGRWTPDDVASALAARDRTRCGPVAPPDGLYLTRVDYAPNPPPLPDDDDEAG